MVGFPPFPMGFVIRLNLRNIFGTKLLHLGKLEEGNVKEIARIGINEIHDSS